MRIEMVGPPAVGKSSIVRALVDLGIERGPKGDANNVPKVWYKFSKYILLSYKGTSHEHTRLPVKSLEGLAAAWIGDNAKIPMVFDELVILNGFSMAVRYPYRARRYFERCPLPAVLVSLDASEGVFRKRAARRERKSGKGRYEKALRFKHHIAEHMPLLKERGCHVLEFDTGQMKISEIAKIVYADVIKLQGEYKLK